MTRILSLLLLATSLAGCTGSGQNALLGDVLSRAMQETSLSSADQGLAVKAVQVATQSAQNSGQSQDAGYAGSAEDVPASSPSNSAEPAGEDAEVW